MIGRKIYIFAALATVGVMLVGCSSDDDDSGDADGTSTPIDGGGDTNIAAAPTGLAGTWTQGCMADDPDEAETEYSTILATFTEDSANITGSSFTDSGCTIAADPAVVSIDFSLVFTGGSTTTSLGAAAHVDITGESATVDGQLVQDDEAELIDLYETDFTLLLVANDILYTGDTDGALDGSTAETRPDMLDILDILTRVVE